EQPDVCPVGMSVDEQIAVGAVFVLADARLDYRAALQRRETSLHVVAHFRQRTGGELPIADIRIDRRSVLIVRNLEAAAFKIREPVVDVAVVEIRPTGQLPGREALIARPRREEKHLLSGRKDARAQKLRKELR